MPEPPARQREELAVVGDREQHLRDREADQLRVGELRRAPRTAMARSEEVIDLDVESDDEGVESGGQRGLQGRRCVNTANFGALNRSQLFRINDLDLVALGAVDFDTSQRRAEVEMDPFVEKRHCVCAMVGRS
jgi:hypothetical protein